MRKVINGKVYDTATARHLGNWCPNMDRGNFHYINENLYITKNGRFFLAGEGHGMTRWASGSSGAKGMGSSIIELSESEARDWCEQHDINAAVIEEHFKCEEA